MNLATFIVAAALAAIVIGVCLYLRREKKQGRSLCGGDCSCCKGCH